MLLLGIDILATFTDYASDPMKCPINFLVIDW